MLGAETEAEAEAEDLSHVARRGAAVETVVAGSACDEEREERIYKRGNLLGPEASEVCFHGTSPRQRALRPSRYGTARHRTAP